MADTTYRYTFANGDVVELQVQEAGPNTLTPAWLNELSELDRIEYNNDHKETRRHCSLDSMNRDDSCFAVDEPGYKTMEAIELWRAMYHTLTPRERCIAEMVFFEGYTKVEVAQRFKISHTRVAQILRTVEKKLRKITNKSKRRPKK